MNAQAKPNPQLNRCRIVLITPKPAPDAAERLEQALSGGDVASVIIPQYDVDDAQFQIHAEKLVRIAQAQNVAAIVAGEPRIAARVNADGIHMEGNLEDIENAIEKYQGKMAVGCGGVKDRDDALELGELQPDYIFFGRFGYDTKPETHPRNLGLASWWADMIEIPCIIMAGSELQSIVVAAQTGADFVATCEAVFADGTDPAAAVRDINARLDAEAPQFGAA